MNIQRFVRGIFLVVVAQVSVEAAAQSVADKIEALSAVLTGQSYMTQFVVDIPVCDKDAFDGNEFVFKMSYVVESRIAFKEISTGEDGGTQLLLDLVSIELSDVPDDFAFSFKSDSLLGDSQQDKMAELFTSVQALEPLAALGLQAEAKKQIRKSLLEKIALSIAELENRDNIKVIYDGDEVGGDAVAAELKSILCDSALISVSFVKSDADAIFSRGYLPRKKRRSNEKVFLKNSQGDNIAYAYKRALSGGNIALIKFLEKSDGSSEPGADNKGRKPVGGGPVSPTEDTSHVVAVARKNEDGSYSQFCAGTLVSEKHVLTAAHCNIDSSHVVIVGRKIINGEGGVVLPIGSVWRHIDYKKAAPYDSDIAVIVLDKTTQEAGLGDVSIEIVGRELITNDDVEVMGWGAKVFGGRGGEELYFVTLDILNEFSCKNPYEDTRLKVTENMICAYRKYQDACQGDSGGGAYFYDKEKQKKYLGGIVSFGIGCASDIYHGVYTKAYNFRSWLDGVQVALAQAEG